MALILIELDVFFEGWEVLFFESVEVKLSAEMIQDEFVSLLFFFEWYGVFFELGSEAEKFALEFLGVFGVIGDLALGKLDTFC